MTPAPEAPPRHDVSLGVLTADQASFLGGFTFPSYGHMLTLEPTFRHPNLGDTHPILPLAVGAMVGTRIVGLALAEIPIEERRTPELLSLFVEADFRNQGIGTALVRGVEGELARRGFASLQAVWMTGRPEIVAVERIFANCGWSAPTARTLVVHFTPEEIARVTWLTRCGYPGPAFEVFAWSDLRPEERRALRASQAADHWIDAGFEPWLHEQGGFDAVSSMGLRYRHTVVGWVLNHRLDRKLVRFTCSFMRADLRRRGRIVPLFAESIRRLRTEGGVQCRFVTPVAFENVVGFIRRRCANVVSFVGETRGSTTRIVPTVQVA